MLGGIAKTARQVAERAHDEKASQQLRNRHVLLGRAARAMAGARPDRRGHEEAQNRRREHFVGTGDLLQPSRWGRQGRERRHPRGRRPAVRDPHGRAERLHPQRRPRRHVHPSFARPDNQRYRSSGRGRAAGRNGLPGFLRQDDAGPAHGGGPAQPSDPRGGVRLSAQAANIRASTSTSKMFSCTRAITSSATPRSRTSPA